jgi:hypothetical protein
MLDTTKLAERQMINTMRLTERQMIKGYIIGSSLIIVLLLAGMIYLSTMLYQVNQHVLQTDCDAATPSDINNSIGPASIHGLRCDASWQKN